MEDASRVYRALMPELQSSAASIRLFNFPNEKHKLVIASDSAAILLIRGITLQDCRAIARNDRCFSWRLLEVKGSQKIKDYC